MLFPLISLLPHTYISFVIKYCTFEINANTRKHCNFEANMVIQRTVLSYITLIEEKFISNAFIVSKFVEVESCYDIYKIRSLHDESDLIITKLRNKLFQKFQSI